MIYVKRCYVHGFASDYRPIRKLVTNRIANGLNEWTNRRMEVIICSEEKVESVQTLCALILLVSLNIDKNLTQHEILLIS